MTDGRIDQQFAELFISSPADESSEAELSWLWVLTVAAIIGLALCALASLS